LESAAVPTPGIQAAAGPETGDKGLKKNAIGFVSSVVIGVASTAPGYSLAATLGFVAAVVALGSPAILLISFIPMFLVAGGYYYMNKADPDCGTSFSWVTKAMGPQLGWIAGWAIVVADIVVMANLAQIAGLYTFELFGLHGLAESTVAVTAVGVIWIVIMTANRARSIVIITGRLRRNSTHGPSGKATSAPTAGPTADSADTSAGLACSTRTAISGNAPNPSPEP